MGQILSYVVGVLLSFAISLSILLILRAQLTIVLTELCHGKDRAAFWVLMVTLIIILSSSLLALMAVPSTTNVSSGASHVYFWGIARQLKFAVLGMIVSLLIISAVIGNSIVAFDRDGKLGAEGKDK
jgi:hypothetical protein